MARGWESKSVEAQQAEAADNSAARGRYLSPDEVAKYQHREGLLLSRSRVLKQLEAAQNPQHREVLERALSDLNARLAKLGWSDGAR